MRNDPDNSKGEMMNPRLAALEVAEAKLGSAYNDCIRAGNTFRDLREEFFKVNNEEPCPESDWCGRIIGEADLAVNSAYKAWRTLASALAMERNQNA